MGVADLGGVLSFVIDFVVSMDQVVLFVFWFDLGWVGLMCASCFGWGVWFCTWACGLFVYLALLMTLGISEYLCLCFGGFAWIGFSLGCAPGWFCGFVGLLGLLG